jgi:hypothetical protein
MDIEFLLEEIPSHGEPRKKKTVVLSSAEDEYRYMEGSCMT